MDIGADHHIIRVAYNYNYRHNATSIANVLKMIAATDKIRDLQKAKASGKRAGVVSQGLTKLQQLFHNMPPTQYAAETSDDKTKDDANTGETTTDTKGSPPVERKAQGHAKQATSV